MPVPPVNAVAGDPEANSFVTVAEAAAYFDGRLGAAAWTGATADERAMAVISATTRLDQLRYVGVQTYGDQRLKWPRQLVLDDDGFLVDELEVPRQLKEATYEEALYLLANKTVDAFAPTGLEQFKRVKTPAAEIEMRDPPKVKDDAAVSDLPRQAYALIRRWLLPVEVPAEQLAGTFRVTRK